MKLLLIATMLLLTGCANFSEYRQGCYDALDVAIDQQTLSIGDIIQLENHKNLACNMLVEKRARRSRKEIWAPRNIHTPRYRKWRHND